MALSVASGSKRFCRISVALNAEPIMYCPIPHAWNKGAAMKCFSRT
jgi:hypothetical protein